MKAMATVTQFTVAMRTTHTQQPDTTTMAVWKPMAAMAGKSSKTIFPM